MPSCPAVLTSLERFSGLLNRGTIFVSTFGRRTKEYLKYMFGEGGIYEQLQELKMPAEEVLTKALTFLDPLVPGKEMTVSIKSFDPPSVKESRARARAAAKRSDALEAGIKQELKDYFGWLQRFAKDVPRLSVNKLTYHENDPTLEFGMYEQRYLVEL